MKINAWYFLITLALLIAILITAYLFIPFVRYILIPITGGTKAPDTLEAESPKISLSDYNKRLLANQQQKVPTIEQVPEQNGWINYGPQSVKTVLKDLQKQNKVVLIDFWTYSCINCVRATPYTKELWDRYKDHGLMIIGVHSPEFDFERNPKNILAAVKRAGITYPVLTDADKKVWKAFGNHFWPGKYLIDPRGIIIYKQFGEGDYAHEEQVIRKTLEKFGAKLPDYGPTSTFLEPFFNKTQTPELYAGPGFIRRAYGNYEQPKQNQTIDFKLPTTIQADRIYLQGSWLGSNDYVQSITPGAIVLKYSASAPYIVLTLANENKSETVDVLVDGKPVPEKLRGKDITVRDGKTIMMIDEPRLYYPIAENAPYGEHTIRFNVPVGIRFYSFTFGVY